jgi:hypothetical protein
MLPSVPIRFNSVNIAATGKKWNWACIWYASIELPFRKAWVKGSNPLSGSQIQNDMQKQSPMVLAA